MHAVVDLLLERVLQWWWWWPGGGRRGNTHLKPLSEIDHTVFIGNVLLRDAHGLVQVAVIHHPIHLRPALTSNSQFSAAPRVLVP